MIHEVGMGLAVRTRQRNRQDGELFMEMLASCYAQGLQTKRLWFILTLLYN